MSDADDYWNSSQTKAFDFDETNSNEQFTSKVLQSEISLSSTFRSKISLSESVQSQADCLLPIYDIITEENKKKYLTDDNLLIVPNNVENWLVDETITNILLDRPYDLRPFHSLKSKIQLLDKAIASADGNCIITIVLLLVDTLKQSLVFNIIKNRPTAFEHYVGYLSTRLNTSGLTDLAAIKGHNTILVLKLYKIFFKYYASKENVTSLKRKLQALYNHWFENSKSDENDAQIIKNFMLLLDWQVQSNSQREVNISTDFSVNSCIRVYCHKFWNTSDDHPGNPNTLGKQQDLSLRQLHWLQLDTKLSTQSWDDILKIFIKNSWFGNKKVINTVINAENIVIRLGERNAPSSVLEKFLSMMDDTEKSMSLAVKFKCHRHVINLYVQDRDRIALEKYKLKIRQSEEYYYAEEALHSVTTKWKN